MKIIQESKNFLKSCTSECFENYAVVQYLGSDDVMVSTLDDVLSWYLNNNDSLTPEEIKKIDCLTLIEFALEGESGNSSCVLSSKENKLYQVEIID